MLPRLRRERLQPVDEIARKLVGQREMEPEPAILGGHGCRQFVRLESLGGVAFAETVGSYQTGNGHRGIAIADEAGLACGKVGHGVALAWLHDGSMTIGTAPGRVCAVPPDTTLSRADRHPGWPGAAGMGE